jgi:DNA-binding transcriptional regulator YiaG
VTPRALQRLRKRLGWSQQWLAEALEVYPTTVSKWERGVLPIDRRTEMAIRCLAEHSDRSPRA